MQRGDLVPWRSFGIPICPLTSFNLLKAYTAAVFLIRNRYHIATVIILFFLLFLLGPTLRKSLWLRRFKSDPDGIWQECSAREYASIDGVGFST